MSDPRTPWPQYKSHKIVEAAKITAVNLTAEGANLELGPDFHTTTVNVDYINKHGPQPGGYIVRYEDGYLSWSPAKAFEEGYTLVDDLPGLRPTDALTTIEQYDEAVKIMEPGGAIAVKPDLIDEIVARDRGRTLQEAAMPAMSHSVTPGVAGFVGPPPRAKDFAQQARHELLLQTLKKPGLLEPNILARIRDYVDFIMTGELPGKDDG